MNTLIDQIWVILANGSCLLHKNYRNDEALMTWTDTQVISGCMSAIFSLARSLNAGEIECIKMKHRSVYFRNHLSCTIAVVTSNKRRMIKRSFFRKLEEISDLVVKTCDREMQNQRRNSTFLKFINDEIDDLIVAKHGREITSIH